MNGEHTAAECPRTARHVTPSVSVIVPCYNEQSTIGQLLDALYKQTYGRPLMEVVIADGMSQDATRGTVVAFAAAHPDLRVRLVDNPRRSTTSGLNLALSTAKGEVVVRLDGHAIPRPDYVARIVEALAAGKGENVGGGWDIQPGASGWIARAIAAAAAHPLGAGDAYYRFGQRARLVDTVPFGAFYRSYLDTVPKPQPGSSGPYDETLLTNEDYELNLRVREQGGRIWLDPVIRSVYFARSTLRTLGQQYWRYGSWKVRVLHRYPRTARWRQIVPPAHVLGTIALGALCFAGAWAAYLLAAQWLVYVLVLTVTGVHLAVTRKDAAMLVGVPLALVTMHLAWATGFLAELVSLKGMQK